ncbi:9268_t:CDS:2 [Diversispora eburnea]|uniref:9268_t:CDS:1 n=1 Tax=Diversispora eburnea TaxID=1213867 RepID=A0A9N8YV90_9GLOM|nr:9268_t:CDS:2 [Diversispora eburnea]
MSRLIFNNHEIIRELGIIIDLSEPRTFSVMNEPHSFVLEEVENSLCVILYFKNLQNVQKIFEVECLAVNIGGILNSRKMEYKDNTIS